MKDHDIHHPLRIVSSGVESKQRIGEPLFVLKDSQIGNNRFSLKAVVYKLTRMVPGDRIL